MAESTNSPNDQQTRRRSSFPTDFSKQAFKLPAPSLEIDFRLVCKLGETVPAGPNKGGGHRSWIWLVGGHFDGIWGSGIVVPGGLIKQTVALDFSAHHETQYLLMTHDGAYIEVRTEGWRTVGTGGHDALEKLFDEAQSSSVDPSDYTFRFYLHLETEDERYTALNSAMWVASSARLGDRVVYDAYRVL